jgi:hypothetical protein
VLADDVSVDCMAVADGGCGVWFGERGRDRKLNWRLWWKRCNGGGAEWLVRGESEVRLRRSVMTKADGRVERKE